MSAQFKKDKDNKKWYVKSVTVKAPQRYLDAGCIDDGKSFVCEFPDKLKK